MNLDECFTKLQNYETMDIDELENLLSVIVSLFKKYRNEFQIFQDDNSKLPLSQVRKEYSELKNDIKQLYKSKVDEEKKEFIQNKIICENNLLLF